MKQILGEIYCVSYVHLKWERKWLLVISRDTNIGWTWNESLRFDVVTFQNKMILIYKNKKPQLHSLSSSEFVCVSSWAIYFRYVFATSKVSILARVQREPTHRCGLFLNGWTLVEGATRDEADKFRFAHHCLLVPTIPRANFPRSCRHKRRQLRRRTCGWFALPLKPSSLTTKSSRIVVLIVVFH